MTELRARSAATALALAGALAGLTVVPLRVPAMLGLLSVIATVGIAWLVPAPAIRLSGKRRLPAIILLAALVVHVAARVVVLCATSLVAR